LKAILSFIAVAYGLAIALSLLLGFTGGAEGPLRVLSTFVPAIAVVVVARMTGEQPIVRSEFAIRYLPVALFLIPVVLHAAMLPTMALTEGLQWQNWLTPAADGLFHTPPARGWGVLTRMELIGRIGLNAIVGLVVVSFLAFFEEIGWRAWLLPRLRVRMGARTAVIVTSVIWGFWHVPFDLAGLQHIDGVSPVQLALGVPFGVMASGLVLGWLWLRTENVWICAIAHGALNNWGQYAFKYMNDGPATPADLVVLRAGFLALFVVGALLLLIWPKPAHVSANRAAGRRA
jgi:membrane protease YdiL (CAAX protease family)